MSNQRATDQRGSMLVVVLILLAMLMVLIAGFANLTSIEMGTTRSDMRSFQGFYAAEAGLNVRADSFRQLFLGAALPSGTSPVTTGGATACSATNQGSGNFACGSYSFQKRNVQTWVAESTLSTDSIVIPRGEDFQNLFAREYHYIVYSEARNSEGVRETSLEMHFKSRTVPMFQLAAFYNKDLEIVTSPGWVLAGPVHANGDLYLGCDNTLDITGQVTVVGSLYRGRKDANTCLTGPARMMNPSALVALPACSGGRTNVPQASLSPWNGMVSTISEPVSVPSVSMLDPTNNHPYWEKANTRIALNLNLSPPQIEVRDINGAPDNARTVQVLNCGAAAMSSTFYDNRESSVIEMLDLNMQALLTCPQLDQILDVSLATVGTTPAVLFLTVDGPASAGISHYGVRLHNATELTTVLPGGATLSGLTVASDQPVYIWGNYNSTNKKPAAVLGDTVNFLSNNWLDSKSTLALGSRVPTATTVNVALLAGTDRTGGAEGPAGQDGGTYNGGLEGLIRLHENWSGTVTLTYKGSFVSLFTPRHAQGSWAYGGSRYTAPLRVWSFDDDFEDPETLPPLTPNFVYLRQELFVRRFEL